MDDQYYPMGKIVPALFAQGLIIEDITEWDNQCYIRLTDAGRAKSRQQVLQNMDLILMVMMVLRLDDEALEFEYSALPDGRTYIWADTRRTLKGGFPYEPNAY